MDTTFNRVTPISAEGAKIVCDIISRRERVMATDGEKSPIERFYVYQPLDWQIEREYRRVHGLDEMRPQGQFLMSGAAMAWIGATELNPCTPLRYANGRASVGFDQFFDRTAPAGGQRRFDEGQQIEFIMGMVGVEDTLAQNKNYWAVMEKSLNYGSRPTAKPQQALLPA